jgi:UDP-N-acetylglucosamine transferase subunit ALG13
VILLTVGHQMPFDRLVGWVDEWARDHPGNDVLAQVGESSHRTAHMRTVAYLSPAEFEAALQQANAVVAHAGTGTILKALYLGKPLLVVPRLAELGETRNDHQVGTALHFAEQGLLQMANTRQGFSDCMHGISKFKPRHRVGGVASAQLLARVSEFINR